MIKQISLFAAFLIFTISSFTAFAKDLSESEFLLREAMMESNADYNVHKGKANLEEFDRADTWVERKNLGLVIGKDPHFVSNTEEVQNLKDLVEQDMSIGQRGLSNTDN